MAPKSRAKDAPGTLGFESLGKKGEGVEFKRKKLKNSVEYGGLRRSSRLSGSGATSHSAAGPTAHTAACVLGCPDILHQVFALLDSPTLARCAAVCRQWTSEAHAATLWKPLCEELWDDKMHVPARQQIEAGSITYCRAYPHSLQDCLRSTITSPELCSFSWQFRFKEAAGDFFVQHDPWYSGQGPPMKRRFHPDGSITPDGLDAFFSGHENRWKFTRTKQGVSGLYVKVNHWPALEVSRTANWGWRLENCWVMYESHP